MPRSLKQQQVIDKTAAFIAAEFAQESTGHDWHHIRRVWDMAKEIGAKEGADMFIVELGALLHDIADWKSHDDGAGAIASRQWLKQFDLKPEVVDHVCDIVNNVSFKGLEAKNKITSLEGKVVQDADRLDAIGAIAIARAFTYGGAKGRPIYDPAISLDALLTDDEYRATQNSRTRPTLNHFYDKLLHLKGRLNTKTARKIGQRRHQFMEDYLEEFFLEWGKD